MNNTGTRRCPWVLCLCGHCPNIVRVKRVRVALRGEIVTMTGKGYAQYRDALQAKTWAAIGATS